MIFGSVEVTRNENILHGDCTYFLHPKDEIHLHPLKCFPISMKFFSDYALF